MADVATADGRSQFLALPAKVRQKEQITIGDVIEVSFVVR